AARVVRELPHVDPDLALERRARRLEDPDDLPAATPELELAPDLGSGVAAEHALPDDRLARARPDHPPGDDRHVVVHPERDRLHAAHEHVLAPAVARPEERLHDELGRRERTPFPVARDAVEEADRLEGLERDLARAVVVRALAHDDEVERMPGRD